MYKLKSEDTSKLVPKLVHWSKCDVRNFVNFKTLQLNRWQTVFACANIAISMKNMRKCSAASNILRRYDLTIKNTKRIEINYNIFRQNIILERENYAENSGKEPIHSSNIYNFIRQFQVYCNCLTNLTAYHDVYKVTSIYICYIPHTHNEIFVSAWQISVEYIWNCRNGSVNTNPEASQVDKLLAANYLSCAKHLPA